MLIIKKLLMKMLVRLNQLSTVKEVTLTRAENNYVNATNFARLKMRRIGIIAIFEVNLAFSTSLPSNSTWVKIGTYSGVTLLYDVNAIIPGQGAQAHVLLSVESNGNIRVYNASGTATGAGFYRAQIPMILSGGGIS